MITATDVVARCKLRDEIIDRAQGTAEQQLIQDLLDGLCALPEIQRLLRKFHSDLVIHGETNITADTIVGALRASEYR